MQLQLLSETQVAISHHYARSRAAKNFKLVPNLMSKKNYLVYDWNLKFYQEDGMSLTKIHQVKGFTTTRWMEPYI